MYRLTTLKIEVLINVLTSLLFIFTFGLPMGVVVLYSSGYTIEMNNYVVFTIMLAIIPASLVVISLKKGNIYFSKLLKVMILFILPGSLMFYLSYLLGIDNIFGYLFSFIYIGCCGYLTIRYGSPLVLKILVILFSLILMLPTILLTWFGFFFTLVDFVSVKTLQTLESPDSKFVASVVEHDEGALGGSTTVDVCENFDINLMLFEIKRNNKRLYRGKWGEGNNLEIYWKDNETLVINSVEYDVIKDIE